MNYYILHTSFDKIAGIERVLYSNMEYLRSRPDTENIYLLLCSSQTNLALDLSRFSVHVIFLEMPIYQGMGTVKIGLQHLKIAKFLKKQIDLRDKATLIGTNVLLATCFYLAFGRKKNVKQIISTEHFSITEQGKFSSLLRKVFYKYFTVVTLTEVDLCFIRKAYNPKRLFCVPNAIPFVPRPYVYEETKKTIIALGRFTPQKGFDLLIQSFASIALRYPDWNLLIVGHDYGDRTMLEALIAENKISNVQLKSAVSDVNSIYSQAAFYVMSSRFEGFPMVLLEALGFGLPIVSFDCPTGPRELVNDTNGILVENGNIVALASAMEQLMSDRELLQLKSKGAEKFAQNYTKEVINTYWDEII